MTLIDMSAENNRKNDVFNVYIKDMAGHSITIEECTAETLVSSLIEQFRKGARRNNGAGIPKISKRQHIILTNDMGQLNDTTLGDNNIKNTTNLFVVYDGIPSCINSEPIAEHLHQWIEGGDITFNPPFQADAGYTKHIATSGTQLLAEYNNLNHGGNYLFFLTNTAFRTHAKEYSFMSNVMGNRQIKYCSGMSGHTRSMRDPAAVPEMYIHRSSVIGGYKENISVRNNCSIRGIFERIELRITQMHNFAREFFMYVVLKAPFKLYSPNGTVLAVSYKNDEICYIPYDYIAICNENGQSRIPNNSNLSGGRRSKRSKRSQKKRKTRRTHRK